MDLSREDRVKGSENLTGVVKERVCFHPQLTYNNNSNIIQTFRLQSEEDRKNLHMEEEKRVSKSQIFTQILTNIAKYPLTLHSSLASSFRQLKIGEDIDSASSNHGALLHKSKGAYTEGGNMHYMKRKRKREQRFGSEERSKRGKYIVKDKKGQNRIQDYYKPLPISKFNGCNQTDE